MNVFALLRRGALAVAAAATLVGAGMSSASAITDGTPDGTGHPHVALMVAKDIDGSPMWRCSGTFISPTVYLTAGHCTSGATRADIYLSSGPIPLSQGFIDAGRKCAAGVNGYPCSGDASGVAHTHPDFSDANFTLRDVGVVVLDAPVTLSSYGTLPKLNVLDAYKTERGQNPLTFTAVGYGLQKSFPDAAAWKDQSTRIRMVAHPKLNQINTGMVGDFALLLSNNAKTGGTCFGDSGGPNFIGSSNVVGGVTSFGINSNCAGTGGVFRMDRSWALNWVKSFL